MSVCIDTYSGRLKFYQLQSLAMAVVDIGNFPLDQLNSIHSFIT